LYQFNVNTKIQSGVVWFDQILTHLDHEGEELEPWKPLPDLYIFPKGSNQQSAKASPWGHGGSISLAIITQSSCMIDAWAIL